MSLRFSFGYIFHFSQFDQRSTFNGTESVTTLSEMNSVCGNSMTNMAQQIVRLQEEIRLMKAGKPSQSIPPCWITKETEAVEQCLDEFRVAFNEAKQFILEKRNNEDIAEGYEENKKAAQITEEVKEVWMSAARDVKKHLGEITNTLNGCCGKNSAEERKMDSQLKQQLWMDLDRSGIPDIDFPVVNSTDVVPVIDAESIKICKGLVGTWKFNDASVSRPCEIPTTLVISFHNSGFFVCEKRNRTTLYFRPDGKRYQFKEPNYWERECNINDDQIVCRYILRSDGRTEELSFRCVSETRIEYTCKNSKRCSYDGTYSYIADV